MKYVLARYYSLTGVWTFLSDWDESWVRIVEDAEKFRAEDVADYLRDDVTSGDCFIDVETARHLSNRNAGKP